MLMLRRDRDETYVSTWRTKVHWRHCLNCTLAVRENRVRDYLAHLVLVLVLVADSRSEKER